ncbi:MAG TPA: tol-pal system protein YbgF [Nitrospiraceae bacterium]|nr:tol-pal system protein YbgF [Nitrospiraceae bacterium]
MSLIAQAVWKWSLPAAGGLSGLVLAGCLAQQADVKNQKLELQKSIRESKTELQKSISESKAEMKTEMDRIVRETRARLNEDISQIRERELAALRGDVEKRAHEEDKLRRSQDDIRSELSQAANKLRKELTEQSNLVTASRQELKLEQDRFRNEIKAEQDRLRSDQERFRNDFKEAVTKDLSKLSGDSTAQVAKLSIRLDEIAARLATTENIFKKVSERLEKVSERLDEQQRDIKNAEAKSAGLAQKVDAQDKNVADLRQALGDFKLALSGLGDKIVSQDKAATDLSGSVSQQASVLAKRLDGLSAKLDADMKSMTHHVNEVNKTTGEHLEEVNKSVNTVAKALESAGDKFVNRLDEQDRRLEELAKYVAAVQDFTKRVEQQLSERALHPAPVAAPINNPPAAPPNHDQVSIQAKAPAPRVAPPSERSPQPASFSGPTGRDPARERYEQLLGRMREGDLPGAQEGFAAFLSDYPNSDLSPNARFWLGESYYGQKDYRRAIDAYERVERDYPHSEKVPSAILKKGYAYLALRDRAKATATLQQLLSRYPNSQEAGKATEKLAQLKKER